MNSNFDKQTSEGLYTFSQDEVFEALKMWCFQKGIMLDKNSVTFFDVALTGELKEDGLVERGFIIEIAFNHLEAMKKAKT